MQHPLYDKPKETELDVLAQEPSSKINDSSDDLFVFDELAVDDNYDGRLAEHQIREFRRQIIPNVLWSIAVFSLALFLGLTAWNPNEAAHSLLALTILFVIAAGICFTWFRNIYTLLTDLREKKVLYSDGEVRRSNQIHLRSGKNAKPFYTYYLEIDGFKFKVTSEIYLMCEKEVRYRVYYTAFGHEVVNVHSL